jgi:hypothetical protein
MLDDYQDLIDELLSTPRLLRELLAGLEDDAAREQLLGLIAGLRDRDRVVLDRLQRLTRETSALLKAIPDADEAPIPSASAEEADALLASFDTARGDLISLLMNLTLKDWSRTATHAVDGEITLAQEVERHVEFDEAYVERAEAL